MKRVLVFGLMAILVASSALAAYVVILHNGTRIVAREKYQIKGSNAVIALKNGTLTSIG